LPFFHHIAARANFVAEKEFAMKPKKNIILIIIQDLNYIFVSSYSAGVGILPVKE
jgi:hypothetical protein